MTKTSGEVAHLENRRGPFVLSALAVVLLLVATFWWTGRWMVTRWEQPNSYYSHGWLIPVVSFALIYFGRKRIAAAPVRPCWWGMLILAPSVLIHLVATAWQVGFLSGFSLLGVLAGLVLTLFGKEVVRWSLFPIAFLAFMVPLPVVLIEQASFKLKLLAAGAATGFLGLLDLPAVRQGSYIRTPGGTVIVDDVCSGLKYLIALLAFGALYAYVSPLKRWRKLMLFGLAAPVSFVANVVRVTLMVSVAYFWGAGATQKWYSHDLFGFALFAIALVLLFGVESVLLGRSRLRRAGEESASDRSLPPAGESSAEAGAAWSSPRPTNRLGKTVVCALVLSAVLSNYLAWPRSTAPATDILAAVPRTLGQWRGFDRTLEPRVYDVLGTRDVLSRRYANDLGERVQLLIVLAQQIRRRTHPPEQCLVGEGYTIVSANNRPTSLPGAGGVQQFDVHELILEGWGGYRVVWYFYKSGAHLNTSYWRHQAGVALRKLAKPNAADILVRAETEAAANDIEQARERLTDFLSHAMPAVMTHLP